MTEKISSRIGRWGVLNYVGGLDTVDAFKTEYEAQTYIAGKIASDHRYSGKDFKIVPVRVTVEVIEEKVND